MSGFRAGCARADITPPVGMPYLGFTPRHPPNRGVSEPLFARAVCVEAGGERAVVVSTETIGLSDTLFGPGRSFIGETKALIEAETGIPPSHVLLASCHIHSSAETLGFRPLTAEFPAADEWLEELSQEIARCASDACREMQDVEMKVARGHAPGLSRNRRGGHCLDDEVTVLLFESEGEPDVVIVNYACHPVIMQVQELVSADYVGAMTSAVQSAIPSLRECLFLLGASADINPTVDDSRRFEDASNTGVSLAGEVIRLIGLLGLSGDPEPPLVSAALAHLEFPSRSLPGPEEAVSEEGQYRLREGDGPFAADVQVVRLGSALLAALPGEVFCATGRALKQGLSPLTVLPVSCANGYLGYFAPPEAWQQGGYETALGPWSKVGPQADGMLREAVRNLAGARLAGPG